MLGSGDVVDRLFGAGFDRVGDAASDDESVPAEVGGDDLVGGVETLGDGGWQHGLGP